MNPKGTQLGINEKVEIYDKAGRYLEEGRLLPFVVKELSEKYNADTETVYKLVTGAQNNHWNHLQEKALEMMVQEKSYPEIMEQLQQDEPDNDVVKYIIKTYYGYYEQAEEKKVTVQENPVEVGLALLVFSVLLFLFYHDNAYGIFKIIGWFLFSISLLGFIVTLFLSRKNRKTD